ncbi:MAG: hypothetical protein WDN28_07945 [Chthoniobacter sp.]
MKGRPRSQGERSGRRAPAADLARRPAHAKLLCDFLDGLGIAHDENGTIEAMPPAPTKEALIKAIDPPFRESTIPAVVAVYLHAFQALDENGWPTLGELIAEDSRLQLAAPRGGVAAGVEEGSTKDTKRHESAI